MSGDGDENLVTINIEKIAGHVTVSAEMLGMADAQRSFFLDLFRPDTRTPEQREADERRFMAEVREAQAPVLAAHADLIAGASGLRRAVLELHEPVFGERDRQAHCDGCDAYGYEVEDTEFPCRTYELARDFREAQ